MHARGRGARAPVRRVGVDRPRALPLRSLLAVARVRRASRPRRCARPGRPAACCHAGSISASSSLADAALGALAWAQVLGLPRPLACALGIGLTRRPLRFDNRLIDLNRPFGAALRRAQEDPADRAAALRAARTQVDRMARLRAPDAAWGQLRDEVVAEYRGWIGLLEGDAPVARQVEATAASEPVFDRWRAMHEQAADAQRLLATPTRRRRRARRAKVTPHPAPGLKPPPSTPCAAGGGLSG